MASDSHDTTRRAPVVDAAAAERNGQLDGAPGAASAAPTVGARRAVPAADPSLTVVIVSYRCRDLLAACLRSIEQNPYSGGPTAIIVVDNASRDGTAELVRRSFPGVHIVELSQNFGFSAANNVALREARSEPILLLNPDTEIWPGVLDEMVEFLYAHPRAGIVGCRLVRRDGSFDHAAKRSFPSVRDAVRYFGPNGGCSGYLAPEMAEDGVGPIDAVNGAFSLVRKTAMDEVGLLDEGYWMYAEDLDWCYRFRQAGWEVLYNGQVTTLHIKGGTVGSPRRLRQNWAFHTSMGRFYRKHYAGKSSLLDSLVYAGISAKFGVSTIRNAAARIGVAGPAAPARAG
jgi:N-acetylglucosaminyl-diphospho-decaprenol L-rhamnosyltransferase